MNRKSLAPRVTAMLLVSALLWVVTSPALAAPPPVSPAPPAAPPIPPNPVYHVVQWGENLTRIAMRYGTTVWAIARANGIWNINYIRAGQVLLIPVSGPPPAPWPGPRIYVVQRGDTLSAIAWRFGTTVWAIVQANGLWNPNLIYVGQTLIIP